MASHPTAGTATPAPPSWGAACTVTDLQPSAAPAARARGSRRRAPVDAARRVGARSAPRTTAAAPTAPSPGAWAPVAIAGPARSKGAPLVPGTTPAAGPVRRGRAWYGARWTAVLPAGTPSALTAPTSMTCASSASRALGSWTASKRASKTVPAPTAPASIDRCIAILGPPAWRRVLGTDASGTAGAAATAPFVFVWTTLYSFILFYLFLRPILGVTANN